MDGFEIFDAYHVPQTCTECGGIMVFQGVGEYCCEDCGRVAYDDYGKVRRFLEENPGANAVEVEQGTGVTQRAIRQMLRESRLQVSDSSQAFLHCELCGEVIRSGRFCAKCESRVHKNLEERQRVARNMQGYGMSREGESGQKRFERKS